MKLLMFSAALFLTVAAFGQEQQTMTESHLKTKVGIKGAFDLSYLYNGADVSATHVKPGFDGGIFVKVPVTKGFSIQPELLYSLQGNKNTYNDFINGGSGEYRFNLGYLKLPLLAVVNLAPNFNIHVGGYAAYLINASVKNVNGNGTIVGTTDISTGDFNRWDFGLVGGAAFDIGNVTIGARYYYGLSDIGKSGNLAGDLTRNQKNAVASFYIGFGF
jgi:hypothetical protein